MAFSTSDIKLPRSFPEAIHRKSENDQDNFFKVLLEAQDLGNRLAEEKKDTVRPDDSTLALIEYSSNGGSVSRKNSYIFGSDFSDAACGEPMVSQKLTIDFTPIMGIDDSSFMQKKCLDFWDFVKKHPELQKFLVSPTVEDEVVGQAESISTVTLQFSEEPTPAADWLQKEVGQPSAFETKQQEKYCQNGDAEKSSTCEHGGIKKHTLPPQAKQEVEGKEKLESSACLVDLCKQLEEWDRSHPKSMDPPGPVPTLIHAVMQRK